LIAIVVVLFAVFLLVELGLLMMLLEISIISHVRLVVVI
jgi:hypothetical protein